VDAQVAGATIADANASTKGKIQLAGDLGGTAAAPTVPGLALKANSSDVTTSLALKEDVSNKANTPLGTSTTLYPTQNAVKTYVDAQVAAATIPDANSITKGKIQLAGDLGGTAAAPTVPGLTLKLDANQKGVANGVASLNASGIIPSSQLPPVTVSSTTVVGSDAAMTALSNATVGSIAVRTDVSKNYVLSALPASTLGNWIELLTPGAPVQTVNGYTGAVNLSKTDLGLSNVNNTTDLNKPISTATQNALDSKANGAAVDAALATKISNADATAALALKLDANKVAVVNGVASLDASGKVPTDQIPAISFSSVKVLGAEAEMLALGSAVVGSVVIRTDVNKNYVLAASNPAVLTNWIELLTPAPPVQTVNGYSGNISITKADLGLGNVQNTSDADKVISTRAQTALDTKVDKVTGKSLSTNDYSTAEKTKLAAITGTNTGDQDLSAFATTTALNTKVDKVTGKSLSTNDYSTAEKTKLAAITGTNTGDQDLSSYATTAVLALKAPLASPTFTGTVTTAVITTGDLSSSSVTAPTYASTPRTLTYSGSTISWNPTQGLNAAITLTQNSTLSFTAAPPVGSYGTVVLTQDATGNRTLTLPSTANIVLGSTSTTTVALSTTANAKDILNFYYDGTNCYWNIGQGYGAASTTNSGPTNLASGVTGTLGVANGGTGAATLTGLVKGSGTSAMTAAVAGTDYQAPLTLTTTGSGAASLSGTTLNIPSTTNYALPTASSTVLGGVKVGTNLSIDGSGALSADLSAGNISGTVAVGKGGTGATTLTGLVKGNGTSAFTAAVAGTDFLAPNGSAASLTNFPTFNQSTSGNAATVTTNANLIGDVTSVGNTSTVVKINGTSLASLSTGILKNTTTTGVPTVAIAGTDYQAPITLTTTGTGAATLSGTTLNIPTASSGSTHYIGESYGGGIVLYIWDGGAHGLIGANTELNGGQAMTWGGGSSSYVGTTSYYGVLGGKMNTQRILNVIPVPTYGNGDPQTGQRSAAFYAATYLNSAVVVSGVTTTPQFSDWYLPNAYELTLFATQSSYFPNCNFATHDHWSSSERSDYANLAYALGANSNTYIYQAAKTSTNYVVAIRSF
jgi:hypothetical protein